MTERDRQGSAGGEHQPDAEWDDVWRLPTAVRPSRLSPGSVPGQAPRATGEASTPATSQKPASEAARASETEPSSEAGPAPGLQLEAPEPQAAEPSGNGAAPAPAGSPPPSEAAVPPPAPTGLGPPPPATLAPPPLPPFPLPSLPLPSPGAPPVPLPTIPLPTAPLAPHSSPPAPAPANGGPHAPAGGSATPAVPSLWHAASSRFAPPTGAMSASGLGAQGPAPLQGGGVNPDWASEHTAPAYGSTAPAYGSTAPGYGSTAPAYGSTPPGPGPRATYGGSAAYGSSGATTTLLPLLPPPDVANLPRVWAYSGSASWRPPSRARVGLTLGVALLVLAAALGFVLTRHQTPARALALSLAGGQRMQFRVQFELDARQSSDRATHRLRRTASALRSWRVLGVDAHGVARVLERTTIGTATLNGHRLPKAKPTKAKLRVAPDGRLLAGSLGVLVGSGQAVPSFADFGPILPEQPVRPGDSWDMALVESLPGGETIHGTLHGTLVRYEGLGGIRAAVVATRLVLPLGFTVDLADDPATARAALGRTVRKGETASLRSAGSMTLEQTAWFDPGAGRLLRSSVQGHLDVRTTVTLSGRRGTPVRRFGDFSMTTVAVPPATSPSKGSTPTRG